MKNFVKFFLPTLFLGLMFNACIKEDFDQPPTEGADLGLTPNATIAQLKALHSLGSLETITEEWIIKATVVADDASGNLYQAFVVQDETGGIMVKVEISDSYTLYPVGREVYIKCKGLVLGDYENLIQLGGFITEDNQLGNIINLGNHLVRGKKVTPPAPKVKKISELTFDDVNTLITVTGVQYQSTDTIRTYADPITHTTYNRYLEDCDGIELIVRTSGYASFAGEKLPKGNGNLTGVLGVFRDDMQFLVRDLNDVDMNGNRCGNGGGGGGNPCDGGPVPIVAGVDEDFESGANNDPVDLTGWTNFNVKGSRTWQFKEFSSNIYAQATAFNDASSEMDIWLVSPRIDLTEPQVLTFETAKAFYTHDGFSAWVSTDFECDPTTATWVPLTANLANQSSADNEWISSGDIDLTALVGEKIAIGFHYVGSGTNGQTGTFRVDNVKLGMGGGGSNNPCEDGNPPLTVASVDEDFASGTNNTDIALTGWANVAETGTRRWQSKLFDGNIYVQATAFNDTNPQMASWLVTPLVDITGPKTLSFETSKAFWTHDGLSVWISTDFNCDPLEATWVEVLGADIAAMPNVDHEWIPSGDIDLSDFIGQKVAIGFKYVGSGPNGQTSSYRVDNVLIQ